ncbi:hypothetical protein R83H12_01300 [Fibrobacteria bacterium R8-3-H12]
MIYGEWNLEDAIAVAKEEEREETLEEVLDFIRKGYSLTDIEKFCATKKADT